MNKQPKLTVEQLIIAIEMLSPAEKRVEQHSKHPYSFVESRNLLREIQENLSDEIIAQRGNRF